MIVTEIKSSQDIHQRQDSVVVLGYFDGPHLGHKALFDQARQIADKQDLQVVVLTFKHSPKLVFERYQSDDLKQLTSSKKRIETLSDYGVDQLYLMDFTSDFAARSAQDFMENEIQMLKTKVIVTGFDYRFGQDKKGTEYLKQHFNGHVMVVDSVNYQGRKISSTWIRETVLSGQMTLANQLLGYPFSTRGIVVHGDARGRTIGFPTANIVQLDPMVYRPPYGVYAARVKVKGVWYQSMVSLGENETFQQTELRIEAHLFDFDQEIYGEEITIDWLKKIREMKKFDGIESLKHQLEQDKKAAKAVK